MKFVVVDPRAARVTKVEAKELHEVYPRAGLKPGKVDFGTLYRDVSGRGIVVYEYGLFVPITEAK